MNTSSALSTTAWVLHDLGLAAGFGGSLFGKVALNPSVRVIANADERSRVVNAAWNGYNVVNALSFGTAAATWLVGRTMLSGWEATSDSRKLVLAKDILLGATVATGAANMIAGVMLGRESARGNAPMLSGNVPAPHASVRAKSLQRFVDTCGIANLVVAAGVIGVTAVLAMESGKSARWSLFSRLLP